MLALWSRYRKRLSLLVLLIAAVVIGRVLSDAAPRDVDLAYDLGALHGEFTELHVTYVFEGEEVAGVRFSEAGGLPENVDHHIELSPGRYTIEATLTGSEGSEHIERALRVPTEGIVRIQLFEETALAWRALDEGVPPGLGHAEGAGVRGASLR